MAGEGQYFGTRYRKKPVAVWAVQWTKDVSDDMTKWPAWLIEAKGHGFEVACDGTGYLQTRNGETQLSLGDWIVRSPKGDLYPCSDDVFNAVHEPVEEV